MKKSLLYFILGVFTYTTIQSQSYVIKNYTSADGLPVDRSNVILVDNFGAVWIGSDAGLARFDGENWAQYDSESTVAIIDEHVNALALETVEGGSSILWIGTDFGLTRAVIDADGIESITDYDKNNSYLLNEHVNDIVIDNLNNKWIATQGGLLRFGTDAVTDSEFIDKGDNDFSVGFGFPNSPILSLGSYSNLIFCGTQKGVGRLSYDEVDGISGATIWDAEWSGINSDTIRSIDFADFGVQWYASTAGVSRHSGYMAKDGWEFYTETESISDNETFSVAVDNDNNAFIGTARGLSFVDRENDPVILDKSAGLVGDTVFDVTLDKYRGSVWCATESGISEIQDMISPVSDIPVNHSFSLYPNPASDQSFIKLNCPYFGVVNMQIYDVTGVLLDRETGIKTSLDYKQEMDLSGLRSGIYIIQIKVGGFNDARTIIKR
jgi:ligand-binding sensor domain-containing protein